LSPIGKIIFFLLGFFHFGIVGSLVGLVIGHICVDENDIVKNFVARHPLLRKAISKIGCFRVKLPAGFWDSMIIGSRYKGNPFDTAANLHETRDMAFVQALSGLIASVSEAELGSELYLKEQNVFLSAFVIPPYTVKSMCSIFERARTNKSSFESYVKQLNLVLPENPLVKNNIVRLLFKVVNLNGKISSAELNYLRKLSILFGVPNSTFSKISEEFDSVKDESSSSYGYEGVQAPSLGKDPYKIIGVDKKASDEEIKKVYRDLIRANHPDTLMAAGASKDEIDAANRFMAELNSAYDAIEKERRGIKK